MSASPGGRYYYESEKWDPLYHLGDWPFDPDEFGLKEITPILCSGGGYWAEYKIQDDSIIMDTLHIRTSDDRYPAINGINVAEIRYQEYEKCYRKNGETVKEIVKFDFDLGYRRYCGLNIFIPFTGRLLLGKDVVDKYRSLARYTEYWIFKTIKEFSFEEGILTNVYDHSYTARIAQRETDRLLKDKETYYWDSVNKFVKKNLKQEYVEKTWWLK